MISLDAIRQTNREKVLNVLMDRREATRQELSRMTGMSVPTTTVIVNDLLEEGVLQDAGIRPSSGGRRAAAVRFVPDARCSFGVDITPDTLRIVLVNLDSEVIWRSEHEMDRFDCLDSLMNFIKDETDKVLGNRKINPSHVLGLGLALPGTVDGMLLETAPNLKFNIKMHDFSCYQQLFSWPIFIENEANAGAYAELSRENPSNLVFLSITAGIGCGVLIDGRLYKGGHSRAGEIGHMTVAAEGLECGCGSKDCWELYASKRALRRYYHELSGDTQEFAAIMELVRKGDIHAVQAWERYLDYLALGLRNIILAFDPETVVIGGRISRYAERLLPELKDRINMGVKLTASSFGGDAAVMGAAILPLQQNFMQDARVIGM